MAPDQGVSTLYRAAGTWRKAHAWAQRRLLYELILRPKKLDEWPQYVVPYLWQPPE